MPSFAASALLALASLHSVHATIASTITVDSAYRGGQAVTLKWLEDDAPPLSNTFGPTDVALMIGSTNTQFVVQDIGTAANPAKTKSLKWTVDAAAGPDADYYFLRFQSVSNTTDAGVPLQAFSARFTLSKMSGELSKEAAAVVDGSDSSAPVRSASARASDSASALSSINAVNKAAAPTSSGSSSASASAASQGESSGADRVQWGASFVLLALATASLW